MNGGLIPSFTCVKIKDREFLVSLQALGKHEQPSSLTVIANEPNPLDVLRAYQATYVFQKERKDGSWHVMFTTFSHAPSSAEIQNHNMLQTFRTLTENIGELAGATTVVNVNENVVTPLSSNRVEVRFSPVRPLGQQQ